MKILTIDIETTGLDPVNDQILEVGMIVDDLSYPIPLNQLPAFQKYIWHPRLSGDPVALAMNAHIIKIISEKDALKRPDVTRVDDVINQMSLFLVQHFPLVDGKRKGITATGKNAGTFDIPFIQQLIGFKESGIKFKHRVLDIGSIYFDPFLPEIDALPSLQHCLNAAGIGKVVTHTALDDCRLVVELYRKKYGIPV